VRKIFYELILIFDRFKGYTVKDIFRRLPKDYCSIQTLYNYHIKYKKADKKARELIK
jgi:hypothetical protein